MVIGQRGYGQTGVSGVDTGARAYLNESVFGLGANFSPLSGIGLSMRQHLPLRFSYMIDGYYAKTTDGKYYSYGAELQYDLIFRERVRFYVLTGASHFYSDQTDSYYDPVNGSYRAKTGNTFEGPDRLGAGFGIETNLIGDDFCVMLEGVFVSYQPTGEFIPGAAGSLHYYFR